MRLLGIGDLHLDATLKKYIPDLNQLIFETVHSLVQAGQETGCSVVVLYGDITDKPGDSALTQEALRGLLTVFTSFPDLLFVVLRGNHEVVSEDDHSLLTLCHMVDLGVLANVKVITEPTVLWQSKGTPVNFLPWPHTATKAKCLNVLHVDAYGAKHDSGRPIDDESALNTSHLCVAGHLHTKQRVRNTYFSGNVYQKTFAESPNKFCHIIDWTGDTKTSRVIHRPIALPFTLANVVLASLEEYEAFRQSYHEATSRVYYKVFVDQRSVLLPDDPFKGMPNVVKHNHFSSEAEFKAQLSEELALEDESSHREFDAMAAFQDWMLTNGVEDSMQAKAKRKLEQLLQPVSSV